MCGAICLSESAWFATEYRKVAFRRILWAARASEKEKEDHPELFTCAEWSNKALERKRAQAACDTKAPPAKKEKRGKRKEM